jgi:RNA polymerase sigma-70 factor (ECF subfamily)
MTPAEIALRGDDDLVMSQVKTGDVDAFAELYGRHCDRAYRVARAVCHDHSRAEEAVQEAFLSIWKARAAYHPQRGTVAAWLLTTVRYRAIDVARNDHKHARRRVEEEGPDPDAATADFVPHVVSREEASRLRELLAGLPDAQREVITLAFYGELTHAEIATALQLPAGTVKGRMRLGLKKLRTCISTGAAREAA